MDNMEQPEVQDSELPDTPADSDHEHETDPADQNEGDGEQETDAEEEAEIEVDGRKFTLPKSVADKLQAERSMQADYTRKTQAVAADRQTLEAERTQFVQQKETQQQFIKDMAKVEALNDQLAVYDNVDWQKLISENPQDALMYQEQRRALEVERNKAAEAVTQKQNQFALDEQQAFAKQLQDAEAFVQREIPGWTPDRQTAVREFVAAQGVKLDQGFARVLVQNPALMKLFDQAEKFQQLAKKQTAKPAAPPVPAPVTRVSAARQGAQKDPGRMSTDEWMAHRTAQLNRKR